MNIKPATTLIIGIAIGVGGVVLTAAACAPEEPVTNPTAPAQAPEDVIDSLPDIVLVPCPEEDSRNCYWDATLMGNGVGRSFVNIGGVTYYPED